MAVLITTTVMSVMLRIDYVINFMFLLGMILVWRICCKLITLFVAVSLTYQIGNTNQCRYCHQHFLINSISSSSVVKYDK